MAMPRLWAFVLCAPRRCSTSVTVPMTRTTTGSLLWKKPVEEGRQQSTEQASLGEVGLVGSGTPASAHTPHPSPAG